MISAENITKKFNKVTALDDVSFGINDSEIFGFIGPDGAGKTTLFRIITTLMLADSGAMTINGHDVVKDYRKLRNMIGYMPGRFSLYQDLTVEENLSFFSTIFGISIKENYELIKPIYSQIEPFRKRQAGKLSGGMKQKLALSCALIHKPEILVLDEPTTGVDAVSRKEFWDMLKDLKTKGITIIVSTPYMDEASLCDRVALIQKGRIMTIDTPLGITNAYSKDIFAVRSSEMYQLILDLRNYSMSHTSFPFGQYVHLTAEAGKLTEAQISDYLKEKGHSDIAIQRVNPGIEDCFMDLMQEE